MPLSLHQHNMLALAVELPPAKAPTTEPHLPTGSLISESAGISRRAASVLGWLT